MVLLYVGAGGNESTGRHPHAVRNHYLLGAVGLAITAVVISLSYSTLLSIVNVVPLLSTTFVTVVAVVSWVLVWLFLDAAHDRYVRRGDDRAE